MFQDWGSCRVILLLMSFLGFINVYCLRVNLSVALVVMVNRTAIAPDNDTNQTSVNECPGHNTTSNTSHMGEDGGEFNWDSNEQGLILAAFFYGYIFTQIPGGWLAERYGGKWPLGLGILGTSLLTLITPFAARFHVYALIAVRVLEGVGEGVTFPAMHAILAKWAPPYERSKMGTFVYAGAQLGTVIGMPLSGFLCRYGWPLVFYVCGSAGVVWFVFWCLLVYNSPAQHPRISAVEREYIETRIGPVPNISPPVPWKSVFTSVPVWACSAAHFSNNWGYYTLLTCLPTYMKDVLKFNIGTNGTLSGLPYLANWIVMTLGGQLADCLRQRHHLTTQNTRKLFSVVGLLLPGIFLISSGFFGCNYTATVAMVILAVGCSGLAMSGYGVNHLDLAPPFAGTLMGITNTFASIPGFVGPQIVGLLTQQEPSRAQWQKVFYIATGVYCFGALVYFLFGAGKQQAWASDSRVYVGKKKTGEEEREGEEDALVPNEEHLS